MRVLPDCDVAGQDYPVALVCEGAHPINIRRVGSEPVTQVYEFVISDNKLVEPASDARGNVVVDEESHAASNPASNSVASRTSSGATSNQRATDSTEPALAFTLFASTRVGTPERETVGWPRFLSGSTTT